MNVALFIEIKNEYTEHLVDTLMPYIYDGLTSIYIEADRIATKSSCTDKTLLIFQKLLLEINKWSQIRITEETNRIKQQSNTTEYLDKLIKAVIKSNIVLLTYSNTVSNIIGQSFYNALTTHTFIHMCYTECAKDAHNNPYLYLHNVDPMDYKRNQIISQQHIEAGITKAIRKILPINMILDEYLVNSINIINEPPKIELIGANGVENGNVNGLPVPLAIATVPNNGQTIPNQSNIIDENLEKQVMQMIKSDHVKTDQQKIQAIMNIDKILSGMEPTKSGSGTGSKNPNVVSSGKKISSTRNASSSKNSNYFVAPHLLEDTDNENIVNKNLAESDKKLLNIDFDNEVTVATDGNQESESFSSITNRPMAGRFGREPEVSERVDPNNVKLIEDYGMPMRGGIHNHNHAHNKKHSRNR